MSFALGMRFFPCIIIIIKYCMLGTKTGLLLLYARTSHKIWTSHFNLCVVTGVAT